MTHDAPPLTCYRHPHGQTLHPARYTINTPNGWSAAACDTHLPSVTRAAQHATHQTPTVVDTHGAALYAPDDQPTLFETTP